MLPECLRLSTIPAVHCNVAAKEFRLGIQNKLHSPTEWASWIPSSPKKKLTIHVRRLCCSRAPRAVQQRVPLDRASVTRCSAAWSMAPAGYFLLPLQNKTDVPEGQGHRTAKTNKTTNEFKDKPISKRYARGGRKSRWRVCVCVTMGPAALCNP